MVLVAQKNGERELIINKEMWGRIVCYRTTADELKVARRATSCSRQEARSIERRYGDEASARRMYVDPALKFNDTFDGARIIGALTTVGGVQ
jgi:hypothetical protein